MKYINLQQDIILLFIIQLINRAFSQKNYTFEMEGKASDSKLNILSATIDGINCPMIPSLFFPISLLKSGYTSDDLIDKHIKIELNNPILGKTYLADLKKQVGNLELYVGAMDTGLDDCYFGLSLSNDKNLDDLYLNLNDLKNNDIIEHKIFSFDKWEIKNDIINSKLYLGFNHENFTSKDGIKGNCDILINDTYWGCYFNELSLNNKTILLKNETEYYYKIYFTSETYNIQFPESLKTQIINSTDDNCSPKYDGEDASEHLICNNNFFDGNKYFEMILRNSMMNITVEIDDSQRYIPNITENENEDKKIKTRLIFSKDDTKNDLIILPLIMFKNFHVQFNEESSKIYFFTTNPDILQAESEESEKKTSSDSSSGLSGVAIFLIILIIIISIALGFGIFYFIKKKNKTENDINKFNKFEDEEDFKPMDDKRVF